MLSSSSIYSSSSINFPSSMYFLAMLFASSFSLPFVFFLTSHRGLITKFFRPGLVVLGTANVYLIVSSICTKGEKKELREGESGGAG